MASVEPGDGTPPAARPSKDLAVLVLLGAASWLLYAFLNWRSARFAYGTAPASRPIVEVLCILMAAFGCYLAALRCAVRSERQRDVLAIIWLFAIAFRILLLFSEPIQEIDIYRYMWDGRAVAAGVSPYRYSPEQVLAASSSESMPDDLRRLVRLRDSAEPVRAILSRVHFADLPTIYPPASQAIFAVAALTTPRTAPLSAQLVIMKAWIALFNVATLALLIALLRRTSLPVGWSLAYAWCPLVLKEFANSGHLDAIAVSFSMLSLYLLVRGASPEERSDLHQSRGEFRCVAGAGVALAVAVGAKLYPVVLAPVLLGLTLRRFGWLRTAGLGLTFTGAAAVCWPMFDRPPTESSFGRVSGLTTAHSEDGQPRPKEPAAGLKAFLSRWEMNDFLFLIVVENLRPVDDSPRQERPWFGVTSEHQRRQVLAWFTKTISISMGQPEFLLARLLTGGVFVALALYWAWRTYSEPTAVCVLLSAFLTLAWFWLLSPTQNPWYWIWALPLVPFARSRAWLAVSGLVLLYYLRFWLVAHWPDAPVPFSRYHGSRFFDFVVTWLEFGPWFLWLAADYFIWSEASKTSVSR